ncbi:hypothetical protein KVT40_006738 [Elsinoe batatas]|uniref:Myb-like domain-containing protein n=1 Tax=Elsinoe batatas TaxID=2601811 RepID=A0A8K0KWT7_9PEZI|nr:hypothetical protein KVT40_006738 [Elsinoe batatas]
MASDFSAREIELLSAAMLCNKQSVEIDWPKFAAMTGLKEGSARTIWSKIHKKVREKAGQVAKSGARRGKKTATHDLKTTNTANDNKRALEIEEAADPIKPKRARKNNTADTSKPETAADEIKDEPAFTAHDVATSIDTGNHDVVTAEDQSEHGAAAGGDTVSMQSLYRNPPDYEYLGFGGYDASSSAAHDSMGGSMG